MSAVNVFTDVKALMHFSDDYFRRQVPFAAAQAINRTAELIAAAENADILKELDQPTPFTQRTFRVISRASKGRLMAIVDAGRIQARYLEPVATGGVQVVNQVDTIRARGISTNAYGNLPRNVVSKLLAKPGTFVGSVTFKKSGQTVSGIWQRPQVGQRRDGGRGTKGKLGKIVGQQTGLKLLVAFNPPRSVKELLHTNRVATAIARQHFSIEMRRALAQAMATAR